MSETKKSPLALFITSIVTLFEGAEKTAFILGHGVTAQDVTGWMNETRIPAPSDFRSLVRFAKEAAGHEDLKNELKRVLDMPLREATPLWEQVAKLQAWEWHPGTFATWATISKAEGFLRMLNRLSHEDQEDVLNGALEILNARIALRRQSS